MVYTVTIVGADDSVSPYDLATISQKYPFVEWGINVSLNPKPGNPSPFWLYELIKISDKVRLLGILKDEWESDFINGMISLKEKAPTLWNVFGRIQVDITNGYGCIEDSVQLMHDKEVVLFTDHLSNIKNIKSTIPLLPVGSKYSGNCGYYLKFDEDALIDMDSDCWVSVYEVPYTDGTFDLLKVEGFLDKIEEHVTNDSWIDSLLKTPSAKRMLSEVLV